MFAAEQARGNIRTPMQACNMYLHLLPDSELLRLRLGAVTSMRAPAPRRSSNALLGHLAALPSLSFLHLPEARVRDSGWAALTQLTAVTDLHVYSLELKGHKVRGGRQGGRKAGMSAWGRLRRAGEYARAPSGP